MSPRILQHIKLMIRSRSREVLLCLGEAEQALAQPMCMTSSGYPLGQRALGPF